MARDVLILGGAGQVGQMLRSVEWPDEVTLWSPGRAEVDLADPAAIAWVVESRDWSLVVNAAAYTAVDKAESDVSTAWVLNAVAPAILAYETSKKAIPLIQISTDYVFDGRKNGPYSEDDPVNPLGVYGASKEVGEQVVRAGNAQHIILRTAWVYGTARNNFVKTMLRVGRDRETIDVVADQIGSPTETSDIARAICTIAEAIWRGNPHWGTYHITGAGEASWHAFASRIFEIVGERWDRVPEVRPIPTSAYPTPAKRPANSRLNCAKIERDYGFRARTWDSALTETVDALLASG